MKRIKPHPGVILKEEFMEPYGLSGSKLAKLLDIPAKRINDIVGCRKGVKADTAVRLGKLFTTSAEFWMNLQKIHDLSRERVDLSKVESLDFPADQ